jgi:hypothetical protein
MGVSQNDRKVARAICGSLMVPAELTPFAEPSYLLPGESSRDFEAIRRMMVEDIQPASSIEWLWTLDLVELSWEILRYRRLKERILGAHRQTAIEAILQRLDGAGMPAHGVPMVQIQSRRTAAEWGCDPEAAIDIEARLHRSGVDSIDIDAEVFVQARELFLMFDQLMQSAQNRRIGLLREISIRREFATRARRVAPETDRLASSFPRPL